MGLSNANFKVIKLSVILTIILMSFSGLLFAQHQDDLLNKKITLDAEDAKLSHVIATMAKLSDTNIVLSQEVTVSDSKDKEEPRITIHLKDIAIEQALSLVVKAVGLSYRFTGGNTFLVGSKDRIEEEVGERSYVINLNYISADKVVKALDIMPGEIAEVPGQNQIIVRANPETFAEISSRIKEMDYTQNQIEIRARLIEINVTDTKKLGIDWSRLNKLTTIFAEDPMNASGVGLPFGYEDALDVTPSGSLQNFAELPDQQYFQKMTSFDDAFKFSRQLYAFDVTVDWLLENNAAKILTDTRLTAMNGEKANIHIGEKIPYVVQDRDYDVQVEREDVGIKLEVIPTVNKDGQITTKIIPEVSSVTELVGGFVPRTRIRRVESTITVPNNSKIIVGGLLTSNISKKTNKVPLLGDIPFIGRFFRHEHEVIETTDLIIEITPRMVTSQDINHDIEIDERLERRLIEVE
ncbi:MAG: hypothetical protein PHR06_09175 [Candidatus Cloacimonetes bacterium]|nr:hypothetical protein [Candidatus Cloacimonadota bacterium]